MGPREAGAAGAVSVGAMPSIGAMRVTTRLTTGAAVQPPVAKPWVCLLPFGSSIMASTT